MARPSSSCACTCVCACVSSFVGVSGSEGSALISVLVSFSSETAVKKVCNGQSAPPSPISGLFKAVATCGSSLRFSCCAKNAALYSRVSTVVCASDAAPFTSCTHFPTLDLPLQPLPPPCDPVKCCASDSAVTGAAPLACPRWPATCGASFVVKASGVL